MIKNRLDFKLINLAILMFIVFLVHETGSLWFWFINKFLTIFVPFFFAFIIAYSLYPALNYFERHKISKGVSLFIIVLVLFSVIGLLLVLVIPMLFTQLSSLFSGIIAFMKEISTNYDLNIGPLQDALANSFNEIMLEIGKYVSDGALNIIGVSLGLFSMIAIVFSAAIYILSDMKNIRHELKLYLHKKSYRFFHYIQLLDNEMKNYLTGFFKIVFITLAEYTVAFYVIGHPNALLLGFLAAIANLIPYFGGLITNIIAVITAFVISPALFFRTLVTFFILSTLDGYVINPLVYGKTNKVHPLVVIISVFAGGILFGVTGIIISLPLAIIMIATYKFFKEDINTKIEGIKTNKRRKKKEL